MTMLPIKKHLIYFIFLLPFFGYAADGSQLWLRYKPVDVQIQKQRHIRLQDKHETAQLAKQALQNYWRRPWLERRWDKKKGRLKEGYQIKGDASVVYLTAAEPIGLLYGAYHLLRLQETNADMRHLYIEEIPDYDIRILNHWDNLDRTVERGYAGYSLW